MDFTKKPRLNFQPGFDFIVWGRCFEKSLLIYKRYVGTGKLVYENSAVCVIRVNQYMKEDSNDYSTTST